MILISRCKWAPEEGFLWGILVRPYAQVLQSINQSRLPMRIVFWGPRLQHQHQWIRWGGLTSSSFGLYVTPLVSSLGRTMYIPLCCKLEGLFFNYYLHVKISYHGPACSNRRCFQVHIPLPLPKQLVIFGLGEWKCSEATVLVEVIVSKDVEAQRIGILSSETRCSCTWSASLCSRTSMPYDICVNKRVI